VCQLRNLFVFVCNEWSRSACVESHALIIVTEWKEFAGYDYSRIYSTMTHPSHIWDGRNLLPLKTMSDIGFVMHSIGRRA
jgi:UDPglucose 6-dehydrogenase